MVTLPTAILFSFLESRVPSEAQEVKLCSLSAIIIKASGNTNRMG